MVPAKAPRINATKGFTIISQLAPKMTPPARVAFRICSAFIFPRWHAILVITAQKTDAKRERVVFIAALFLPFPTYKAPLKDGQYIQRKRDPMIPNRLL